jgi:tRNA(fMet)-specific endonuclease VapC
VTFVLDTNAVSALMRGDASVVQRLRNIAKEDVSVPQPVLAEIAYGIERLPRSKRRDRLRRRYDLIRAELARTPWTDAVTERFGVIKATLERRGDRIEDFDIAIAAHALANGATLVTTDARHMTRIDGLLMEDWAQRSKIQRDS